MNTSSLTRCICLACWLISVSTLPAQESRRSGELLVKWRDGPVSATAAAGNARIGSTVIANYPELGWQHVQLQAGMSVGDGLRRYQELGTVLAVEPNYRVKRLPDPDPVPDPSLTERLEPPPPVARDPGVHATHLSLPAGASAGVTPNDPRFSSQWNLRMIGATNAWVTTTGSTNVVIAVIDSGVLYKHPDLALNMWRNPGETGLDAAGHDKATNGIDDDGNGYVDDVFGIDTAAHDSDPIEEGSPVDHGSLCAEIIGAVGHNGVGLAGINWHVQIMAIRHVLSDDWAGVSDTLEAYEYVLLMKKRGIDIRATSNSYTMGSSQAWRDAIQRASDAGILVACAAGNDGNNVETEVHPYPAEFEALGVLSVGASTSSDTLAGFSNYGQTGVDLAAPGQGVPCTAFTSSGSLTWSGTSAAAPHVAGAVGLLCSARPESSLVEIKAALLQSVDQPANLRGKVRTNGRLNIARALQILGRTDLPPVVIHTGPKVVTDADLDALRLTVTFNKRMNSASVEEVFSVTNSIQGNAPGSFAWSDDGRSLTFTVTQKWPERTRGFVTIKGQAKDSTGLYLDGNFDRAADGTSSEDFHWSFAVTPVNDEYTRPSVITGESGGIQGDNRGASRVDGEWPIAGFSPVASVHYWWAAPQAGAFTFETADTMLDTLLGIYRWDNPATDVPVEVGSSDNTGTSKTSRVTFLAPAGSGFVLSLASKTMSDTGAFVLRWFRTPAPVFRSPAFTPAGGQPGTKVSLWGTNLIGTTSVLFNGASAPFTQEGNTPDQRLVATVPRDASSGPITVVTSHGSATTAGSFQVVPPPLSISLTASGELEIQWPATSQALVLEMTEDLATGAWRPLTESASIDGKSTRLRLPLGGHYEFFRLRGN